MCDLFAAGEVAFIMEIGAILEDMTTNRAKQGQLSAKVDKNGAGCRE